ncbi:cytochrome c-type biogenesis protein [Noviherbaspirillum denitrificans]|uniref:Cytochrome c-type biogenesis protein n=1 Tax=Noviherbaspirillum denitrificans TaxID=1968433 RepID=A0A254TA43_9BURK|nr:cytochrome c-type biogenesis protein [Noviherbaspirillum denitrificans]OWW19511.1 cytochrome C biogenesis protein [Noviherbaspirillum denitrificans]
MRKLLFILLLAVSTLSAQAKEAALASDNPELEKRVMALSEELRCLVCQNQTLADSHAELAMDLKQQVREKLSSGMTNQQVVDYMVERYGDFVMYRPPMKSTTFLLWVGPFALLIGGILVLVRKLSRRQANQSEVPDTDLKRAASLLEGANETKDKA